MSRYLQNLEALEANADVVTGLVTAMDETLASPSYAFDGQLKGEWRQTAGPEDPKLVETSRTASKDFLSEVCNLQTQHALTHPFSGIPQKNEAANFAVYGVPVEGQPGLGAVLVRRCGLVGLYGFTHHTTADQYRIDAPTETTTHTLVLSRLGGTAVHAGEHIRPNDEITFAKRCLDAFADRRAVDALITGSFDDPQGLDDLLARLQATPDQAQLLEELRGVALQATAGKEFTSEFNLFMPDRQKLQDWLQLVRLLSTS